MLQAPVSFRVTGPAIAHLLRSARHLEDGGRAGAGRRSRTSPALVGGPVPRHRRLRRLRPRGRRGRRTPRGAAPRRDRGGAAAPDARRPGHRAGRRSCPPEPGRQAGLVAVHKRAVGLVHAARRTSAPASLGADGDLAGPGGRAELRPRERPGAAPTRSPCCATSTACELLAVHQRDAARPETARGAPNGCERCCTRLLSILNDQVTDRPFGRDVGAIAHVLVRRLGTRRTPRHPRRAVSTPAARDPESLTGRLPFESWVRQPRAPKGSESSMITFDAGDQGFPGRDRRGRQPVAGAAHRADHRLRGPVRLRQDHQPADDQPHHRADLAATSPSTARTSRSRTPRCCAAGSATSSSTPGCSRTAPSSTTSRPSRCSTA